jgi:outer membrane protein assembly factor BamE (lipoprotein component of BamABCDE complex)
MKSILQRGLARTLALAFVAWMAGCASTGQNFDENKVSQIRKGETTESQLVELFGQPQNRAVNSEGMTTLTWQYAESRVKGESFIPYAGPFVGGSNSKHKILTATLGPDGKVTSFSSSAGGLESRSNQVQDVPKSK